MQTSAFNFEKLQRSLTTEMDVIDRLIQWPFIDPASAQALAKRIPQRYSIITSRLLFAVSQQGTSFTQFWRRCDSLAPTLLIIHTTSGRTFGAYCSAAWKERNSKDRATTKFFGTGESFVFTLDTAASVRFGWVGEKRQPYTPNGLTNKPNYSQEMYMAAGNDWLTIGGGG